MKLTETPRRSAFTSGYGRSPVVLHPRQSRPGTSIRAAERPAPRTAARHARWIRTSWQCPLRRRRRRRT